MASRRARLALMPLIKSAVSISWRSLRGDIGRLSPLFGCILLGVAALVAIGSLAAGFRNGLNAEGRILLGGDASFTLAHRKLDAAEYSWLAARGSIHTLAEMGAMARSRSGGSAFIALKAVGSDWPAYGSAKLEPEASVQTSLDPNNGLPGLLADRALGARLGVKLGDRISIGDRTFQLRAWLISEPDGIAERFSLGPRVIIPLSSLTSTGLLGPGALVRWIYRASLPEADGRTPSRESVRAFVREANAAFPTAGWISRSRDEAAPQLRQAMAQLSQFLTLIALTGLIIGGLGVASSARCFVSRRLTDFAILKAIGASGRFIAGVCLLQLLAFALVGASCGAALGASIPFLLSKWIISSFGAPFRAGVSGGAIGTGMALGLLAALIFSIAPVGQAHDSPVAALFRWDVTSDRPRIRTVYQICRLVLIAALILLAFLTSQDWRTAGVFMLCALVALGAIAAASSAFIWSTRLAFLKKSASVSLAFANLHRPGATTRTLMVSLGLSLSLTAALSFVVGAIHSEIGRPSSDRPSLFFLDVPSSDGGAAFFHFVKDRDPKVVIRQAPMIRGRLVKINGAPADAAHVGRSSRWVLSGDRGLSYSDEIPPGTKLESGVWWPKAYSGEPLVSLDEKVAEDMGLRVGSTLTFNVLGREITAKVANLRRVDWRSFGINFIFIFSPNALAEAPHTILATASFPHGSREDLALIRALGRSFPQVSAIRVADVLNQVNSLFDTVEAALNWMLAVVYAMTALVVGAAVRNEQDAQDRQAVILKVFGATRAALIKALVTQYVLIAVASAAVSVLLGWLAALAIDRLVLEISPDLDVGWSRVGAILVLAPLALVLVGALFTGSTLGRRPAEYLRHS